MTYCAYCKGRVHPDDRKCPSCGSTVFLTEPDAPETPVQPLSQAPSAQPQVIYQTIEKTVYVPRERSRKNRWAALGLCLVGGIFGLHRFYAGKIVSGVLYLLTGGLFGFGAIVDFLMILFGNFRDKQGLPLDS